MRETKGRHSAMLPYEIVEPRLRVLVDVVPAVTQKSNALAVPAH